MPTLFQQVQSYFDREQWAYEQVKGETALQLGYKAADNMWTCYAQVIEEDAMFIFYSIAPVEIPQKKWRLASEYLTRANFGLVYGNFELDFRSGLVRSKTSIDVEDDRLSYELFRPVVWANVFMMERYLPGLQAVILEGTSPEDAIQAAERTE
jgi:hypothetical protein